MTSSDHSLPSRVLATGHDEHWISVSDLMALLMLVFLLIAVINQAQLEFDKQRIEQVAVLYDRLKTELYEDLLEEFQEDLPRWGAEITPDLTLRFSEPDVLFESGSSELRKQFTDILDDFFPRYVRVLTSEKYREDIEEIRIEGHTSSSCRTCKSEEDSYFYNMELSQARTRSTLRYVLGLETISDQLPWLRRLVTANGLSFSQLIFTDQGTEDYVASRRVEFRVKTNAEEKIENILRLRNETADVF